MIKLRLGLYKRLRVLNTYMNFFIFRLKDNLLGFDVANQFIQRVDKNSIQFILKKYGATIGKNCDIETGLIFHNNKDYANLIIGNNCHIGKNCFFDLRDKVVIQNNCVVSMQVTFITHTEMEQSKLCNLYPPSRGKIKIEDNVYIGANSIILMNISIGESSFVASGSLVNRDIEKETMWGGVPAKKIKQLRYIEGPDATDHGRGNRPPVDKSQ